MTNMTFRIAVAKAFGFNPNYLLRIICLTVSRLRRNDNCRLLMKVIDF